MVAQTGVMGILTYGYMIYTYERRVFVLVLVPTVYQHSFPLVNGG